MLAWQNILTVKLQTELVPQMQLASSNSPNTVPVTWHHLEYLALSPLNKALLTVTYGTWFQIVHV